MRGPPLANVPVKAAGPRRASSLFRGAVARTIGGTQAPTDRALILARARSLFCRASSFRALASCSLARFLKSASRHRSTSWRKCWSNGLSHVLSLQAHRS